MPSSETLRPRAAADAAAASETPAPRGVSRIIAAEHLSGYTRLAMDSLGDRRTAPHKRTQANDAPPEAPPDYDEGRKSGLVEGFKRGFEAGAAHAEAERCKAEQAAGSTLAQRIESLCSDLQQRLERIEREAADEVVALALEVARQALRATLAVRPESIVPIVQEALAHLVDDHVRLHLHLNPTDAALVRTELGERLSNAGCEIGTDASITPGGCRIETPRATIDATLETRWRRTLASLGRNDDGSIATPETELDMECRA